MRDQRRDVSDKIGHSNSDPPKSVDLGRGGILTPRHDRASVAHTLPLGRRLPGDVCHDRLSHPEGGVRGGEFVRAAYLADDYHGVRRRIGLEQRQDFGEVGDAERVDTDWSP